MPFFLRTLPFTGFKGCIKRIDNITLLNYQFECGKGLMLKSVGVNNNHGIIPLVFDCIVYFYINKFNTNFSYGDNWLDIIKNSG